MTRGKTEDKYLNKDRFVRSSKEIRGNCAPHNIARWEWIGSEGKTFAQIHARNSEYRKQTALGNPTFDLNTTPITDHLDYDIHEVEYINFISNK
jgi:hypothetical protein